MKALLAICLILINSSCGKRNNNFHNRHTFYDIRTEKELEPEVETRPKDLTIKELAEPNIKMNAAYFYLSNDHIVTFNSIKKQKNNLLRRSLLKSIALDFRSQRILSEINSSPSYLILNKKRMYSFYKSSQFQSDIIRYDQHFQISSPYPKISFHQVQASIGTWNNIVDKISLSHNQQGIEESIISNEKGPRSFKTSKLTFNAIKPHLVDLQHMHLLLDDYVIHRKNHITSYQVEKEFILKNHYELILSHKDETKVLYVPQHISFKQALSKIYNQQILFDHSFKIVSIQGVVNQIDNNKVSLDSSFIKLINFKRQDLKELPQAGKSYAIVLFTLKEIQDFGPKIHEERKKIILSNMETINKVKIPKANFSNLILLASLVRNEFHLKQSLISAYVLVPEHFGIKKKKCTVFKKVRNLKSTKKLSLKNKFKIVQDKSKHNYDLVFHGEMQSKVYINTTAQTNSIEVQIQKSPKHLISGILQHNCPKGIKNQIFNSATSRPITFNKKKVPVFDYILDLHIIEKGNIF